MALPSRAYRAFQLLHRSGNELFEFEGDHPTLDAWVIRKKNSATMIVTNLAMPRHPIQTELLNLRLFGAPMPRAAWIERIDDDYANPRHLWGAMGEPEYLSASRVEQLGDGFSSAEGVAILDARTGKY
jgi:xylan 1,4-beta-xylosidase